MTTSEEESNDGEGVKKPKETPFTLRNNCCVNFIEQNWKNFSSALFIGVLPSFVDFSTDSFSAYIFNNGTDYIKNVQNKNDSRVQNCNLIEDNYDTLEEKTNFKYSCFERDPIWFVATIVFMFMPGIITWGGTLVQVDLKLLIDDMKKPSQDRDCGFVMFFGMVGIRLIAMATFPLQLVFVKLRSLVDYSDEWKDTNNFFTTSEGWWESSLQLCLQAFIMLTSYRQPSWIQYVTLVTSLVMITKTSIVDFLEDPQSKQAEVECNPDIPLQDPSPAPANPTCQTWSQWTKESLHSLKAVAVKPAKVFPMFVCNSIFKGGSITLIFVLARYNAIWYFLIVGSIIHTALLLLKFCSKQSRFRHFLMGYVIHSMNLVQLDSPASVECTCSFDPEDFTARQRKENLVFCNFLWFLIYSLTLVGLNILTFYFSDTEFQTFYLFINQSYKLSDMPIVSHPFLLLSISIVILVCGIISFTLICYQVESLRTVLLTFCEEPQETETTPSDPEALPMISVRRQSLFSLVPDRKEQVEVNITDGVEQSETPDVSGQQGSEQPEVKMS